MQDNTITYVYNLPATNTDAEPLLFYFFYIDSELNFGESVVDTFGAMFTIELDSNNKPEFLNVPHGFKAVQATQDSITIVLKGNNQYFGTILYESELNKGTYPSPQQRIYVNGKLIQNSDVKSGKQYYCVINEYKRGSFHKNIGYHLDLLKPN